VERLDRVPLGSRDDLESVLDGWRAESPLDGDRAASPPLLRDPAARLRDGRGFGGATDAVGCAAGACVAGARDAARPRRLGCGRRSGGGARCTGVSQ
jgi:hypothetical protein